jgi:hypothetical protein
MTSEAEELLRYALGDRPLRLCGVLQPGCMPRTLLLFEEDEAALRSRRGVTVCDLTPTKAYAAVMSALEEMKNGIQ